MPLKLYACCLLIAGALVPAPAGAQPVVPLLQLDGGTVDLGWTTAGQGRLRGTATLRGATLRVSAGRPAKKQAASSAQAVKPAKKSVTFPLDVDRLVVHQGAIVFVAPGSPGRELLRIHGLELNVEDFSNRRSATSPTVITADGRIGKAGRIKLSVKAEPGKASSAFSGHAEITGLALGELGVMVDKRLAMQPITGKVGLDLDFSVRDGRINGVVKPSLSGLGVGAPGSEMLGQLNIPLPAEVTDIFGGGKAKGEGQGEGKGREFTAVIPINTSLSDPEPELWTAIVDVLKTSMVEASSARFFQLTPGVGG